MLTSDNSCDHTFIQPSAQKVAQTMNAKSLSLYILKGDTDTVTVGGDFFLSHQFPLVIFRLETIWFIRCIKALKMDWIIRKSIESLAKIVIQAW